MAENHVRPFCAVEVSGAEGLADGGVLGAGGLTLVRGEDNVGRDEEGAVLRRWDHVICHVPDPVVEVVPLLGDLRTDVGIGGKMGAGRAFQFHRHAGFYWGEFLKGKKKGFLKL